MCIVVVAKDSTSAERDMPAKSSAEKSDILSQSKSAASSSSVVDDKVTSAVEVDKLVKSPEVVLHPEEDSMSEASAEDTPPSECTQVCILTDSLLTGLDLQAIHIWPIPGAGIEVFELLLEVGSINPCLYRKIVVAVGSNDVVNFSDLDQVKGKFSAFCDSLFSINEDLEVIFCSVLPRLREDTDTKDRIVNLNRHFRFLAKSDKVKYVRTNVGFIRNHVIRRELFVDGLHLSQVGLNLVKKNLGKFPVIRNRSLSRCSRGMRCR